MRNNNLFVTLQNNLIMLHFSESLFMYYITKMQKQIDKKIKNKINAFQMELYTTYIRRNKGC